ncbi:MAG: hypothetical protein AB2693_17585, partial [Candidatus Thiodiazotropha sp.]
REVGGLDLGARLADTIIFTHIHSDEQLHRLFTWFLSWPLKIPYLLLQRSGRRVITSLLFPKMETGGQ